MKFQLAVQGALEVVLYPTLAKALEGLDGLLGYVLPWRTASKGYLAMREA